MSDLQSSKGFGTVRLADGEPLFVRGTMPQGGIAIIGSRTPPEAAAEFAFELARLIGEPVVSGLASGIDAAAHCGALAAGIPTVAFVGYGFGCTDPPEHAALEEAIVAAGGAVATLLPAGTPATDETRIARDRLQALYSRAVVLVCSEIGGGALYAMRFARDLGHLRFAVSPPEVSDAWAGNAACIADGATALPFDAQKAAKIIASGP